MPSPNKTTQLDSRRIFQFYAAVAALSGSAVIATNRGSLVSVLGACLIGGACMAFAVSRSNDCEVRRAACGWFAISHVVVIATILGAGKNVPSADIAVNLLVAGGAVFYFVWLGASGMQRQPQPLISLFAKAPDVRTRYEESIRVMAGQEERHRLARDLHDAVKQQLFVIQTAAATAQARFDNDPDGTRAAVGQVREAARDALSEMQAMLDQLRAAPLENNGFAAALQKQVEALQLRTGAAVKLELGDLPPSGSLEPGALDALFRTAQEALSNIARHARARNVWVRVTALTGELKLMVRDDGAGFDLNGERAGMGISNMRSRAAEFAGTFEVASVPGQGTTIETSVPYFEPAADRYGLKAAAWAAAVVAAVAVIVWKRDVSVGWVLAMAGLEFSRQLAGWMRMRRVAR